MANPCFLYYFPGFFGHIAGGVAIMMCCFYFLPTIIAITRTKSNTGAILVLNFFLGWTLVGWVVSLVWALSSDYRPQQVVINNNMSADNSMPSHNPPNNNNMSADRHVTPVMIRPTNPARPQQTAPSSSVSDQQDKINQLHQLKELLDNGVLTQEEFIRQKSKILDS
jgi:hypothetical protein